MSQPFIGEIRMFGGNFAPAGWAFCWGQLMPISENDALFNLIGTTYGGDGQETFALPNLQSRVPIHQGQSPGTSNYQLAETGGVESVTLTINQIPSHSHVPLALNGTGNSNNPANNTWAAQPSYRQYSAPGTENANMHPQSIGLTGGSQPHDNIIPYVAINYIISLFGVYPNPN